MRRQAPPVNTDSITDRSEKLVRRFGRRRCGRFRLRFGDEKPRKSHVFPMGRDEPHKWAFAHSLSFGWIVASYR